MGVRNGAFAVGLQYACNKSTTMKAAPAGRADHRRAIFHNISVGFCLFCVEVKLDQDMAVSCSAPFRNMVQQPHPEAMCTIPEVKQIFAKGFSALGGMKYDTKKGTTATTLCFLCFVPILSPSQLEIPGNQARRHMASRSALSELSSRASWRFNTAGHSSIVVEPDETVRVVCHSWETFASLDTP